MRYIIIYFFFHLLYPSADTLVVINNKVITKNDFLRRAEYTIRPTYCNSDNNIDKKIILNSLIAEKLYAIENSDFEIKDKHDINSINGIKEQTMRQVMLEEYVNNNLSIDVKNVIVIFLGTSAIPTNSGFLSLSKKI